MTRGMRWLLSAGWLLCLPLGLWLSGGGCIQQDLAALDLPLTAWRGLLSPGATQPVSSDAAKASAVFVVDIGPGWHRSQRWSAAVRKQRCMQVWKGVEAALSLGVSVVGIDLLLGNDAAGRPNTCAPITAAEKKWWRKAGKHWDERIAVPVALRLPKYVHLRGQTITPMVAGASRRGAQLSVTLDEPRRLPEHRRFAQGHVNLLTDQGMLRRATGMLRWPQGPKGGVPSLAAELARLLRQRASLQGAANDPNAPRGHRPFPIYWGPGRVQILKLRHLQHTHPTIATMLRGAVVLFGAVEAPASSDLFATPRGIISGVEVHAQSVATLLYGPLPHRGGWWQLWLALGLCWLAGSWLGWSLRPWWWRLIAGALLCAASLVLVVVSYEQAGWLPPLWSGGLGLLCGVFGGQGLRLRASQREQRQLQDNIFRSLHPHEGTPHPASPKANEAVALVKLQELPTPIAEAYRSVLEGSSQPLREKPLYDAIMAYGYALAQASQRAPEVSTEAPIDHADGVGNAHRWQRLVEEVGPEGLLIPELYDTWFPEQDWQRQALDHMQQRLAAHPSTDGSLYEQERQAMERWDLVNWFLRERLGWLRDYPLLWLEQIEPPEPSDGMRFDPWAALLAPPPLLLQQMMGTTPTWIERPLIQPLQHHRFYVDLNGNYLTLHPYWPTPMTGH